MINSISLRQAVEHWERGDTIKAGELIFESVGPSQRVKWVSSILSQVVGRSGTKLPAIEALGRIADDPDKWKEAHSAFSKLRDATLDLERLKRRSAEEELLLAQLGLAENVAKVVYNSTNPPDPFDDDSGWWVVVCLKRVTDLLGDEVFSRSMWKVLIDEE